MTRVYSITVPSGMESQPALEALCDMFLDRRERFCSPDAELALRLSVAEGCRHALLQKPPKGRLSVVTLAFLRGREEDEVGLEIIDPGRGFEVGGARPPYPAEFVGREFALTQVMGHNLLAKISTPERAEIRALGAAANEGRSKIEKNAPGSREGGYGLLSLCRAWRSVSYTWIDGSGSLLRLEGLRQQGEAQA